MVFLLLDLPEEIIVEILFHYLTDKSIPDRFTIIQNTCKALRNVYLDSPLLLYQQALDEAAMVDGNGATLSARQKLDMLRRRERSWRTLECRNRTSVRIPFRASHIYDLSAGVYLLGESKVDAFRRDTQTLRVLDLKKVDTSCPGTVHTDPDLWPEIKIENAHIVDIAFCLHEADLLAIVAQRPSKDDESRCAILIYLRELSTGKPHPYAREPEIVIGESQRVWGKMSIMMEIVGPKLVLLTSWSLTRPAPAPHDRLLLINWWTGHLILTETVAHGTWNGFVFITPNTIMVPNLVEKMLEMLYLPDSAEADDLFRRIAAFELPQLESMCMLSAISSRCEPNMFGQPHPDATLKADKKGKARAGGFESDCVARLNQNRPHRAIDTYAPDPDKAIVIMQMYLRELNMTGPWPAAIRHNATLVVPRNAFAELTEAAVKGEIGNQSGGAHEEVNEEADTYFSAAGGRWGPVPRRLTIGEMAMGGGGLGVGMGVGALMAAGLLNANEGADADDEGEDEGMGDEFDINVVNGVDEFTGVDGIGAGVEAGGGEANAITVAAAPENIIDWETIEGESDPDEDDGAWEYPREIRQVDPNVDYLMQYEFGREGMGEASTTGAGGSGLNNGSGDDSVDNAVVMPGQWYSDTSSMSSRSTPEPQSRPGDPILSGASTPPLPLPPPTAPSTSAAKGSIAYTEEGEDGPEALEDVPEAAGPSDTRRYTPFSAPLLADADENDNVPYPILEPDPDNGTSNAPDTGSTYIRTHDASRRAPTSTVSTPRVPWIEWAHTTRWLADEAHVSNWITVSAGRRLIGLRNDGRVVVKEFAVDEKERRRMEARARARAPTEVGNEDGKSQRKVEGRSRWDGIDVDELDARQRRARARATPTPSSVVESGDSNAEYLSLESQDNSVPVDTTSESATAFSRERILTALPDEERARLNVLFAPGAVAAAAHAPIPCMEYASVEVLGEIGGMNGINAVNGEFEDDDDDIGDGAEGLIEEAEEEQALQVRSRGFHGVMLDEERIIGLKHDEETGAVVELEIITI